MLEYVVKGNKMKEDVVVEVDNLRKSVLMAVRALLPFNHKSQP